MADLLQCPNCGKKSLAMLRPDAYHCIVCDFKRDLAASSPPTAKQDFPLLLMIVFITVVVFLTDSNFRSPEPNRQSYEPAADFVQ